MISAISNVAPVQPAAESTPKHVQSSSESVISTDSVSLSNAAQAALAAVQETKETPAQTSQEASRGDHQAQRLLARESAQKVSAK